MGIDERRVNEIVEAKKKKNEADLTLFNARLESLVRSNDPKDKAEISRLLRTGATELEGGDFNCLCSALQ